jgi:hypothetical protein
MTASLFVSDGSRDIQFSNKVDGMNNKAQNSASVEELKSDFRILWAASDQAGAMQKLAELANLGGSFIAGKRYLPEIIQAYQNFSGGQSSTTDRDALVYDCLNYETGIRQICIQAVDDYIKMETSKASKHFSIHDMTYGLFCSFLESNFSGRACEILSVRYGDAVDEVKKNEFLLRTSEFRETAQSIYQVDIQPHRTAPLPALMDLRLAARWTDDPGLLELNFQSWLDRGTVDRRYSQHWELGRCLSARLAELVALEVYRDMAAEVTDVAVSQLGGDGDNWMLYDLTVDGRAIDVKNSRESFSSKSSYSEHCVPTFKKDRNGQDVAIAGVLSS